MSKRKFMRMIYNVLDLLRVRKYAQRIALKIAIMEIEDEN